MTSDTQTALLAIMASAMRRYLPLLEAAESDPEMWQKITARTGIASANQYRHVLALYDARYPLCDPDA